MRFLLLAMLAIMLTGCGVTVREPPTVDKLSGDLTAAQADNLKLQADLGSSTTELQKLKQSKADSDAVFDAKIKAEQKNNADLLIKHRQAECYWAAGILAGLALIATVMIFVISAEAALFTKLAVGAAAAAVVAFGFGEIIPYLTWIVATLAAAGIFLCVMAWRKHHGALIAMGKQLEAQAPGTLANLGATASGLLTRGSTIFHRIESIVKAKA